ncbi:putative phosphoprotein [Alphahymrhavirus distinguendus]|uniref:Phosphoprotein n=1 Tax=Lariophagus distinguendus negative-strand RNA virus 1 TaxID=2848911 RepID=A0A8F2J0V8_9VIRU|nr:putative phosphoprotein [Lariophagus distinguendus negative-strand RNA virus 1]
MAHSIRLEDVTPEVTGLFAGSVANLPPLPGSSFMDEEERRQSGVIPPAPRKGERKKESRDNVTYEKFVTSEEMCRMSPLLAVKRLVELVDKSSNPDVLAVWSSHMRLVEELIRDEDSASLAAVYHHASDLPKLEPLLYGMSLGRQSLKASSGTAIMAALGEMIDDLRVRLRDSESARAAQATQILSFTQQVSTASKEVSSLLAKAEGLILNSAARPPSFAPALPVPPSSTSSVETSSGTSDSGTSRISHCQKATARGPIIEKLKDDGKYEYGEVKVVIRDGKIAGIGGPDWTKPLEVFINRPAGIGCAVLNRDMKALMLFMQANPAWLCEFTKTPTNETKKTMLNFIRDLPAKKDQWIKVQE